MLSVPRVLGAAALAIALGGGTAAAQAQPAGGAKTQHTDALRLINLWLEAQTAYDKVPALSAGIVIGKDLVWAKGYGHVDDERQVPADRHTVYSICSISKLFTSIATMQLWESDKLSLDVDIGTLLPSLALQRAGPDAGRITPRGLMSHAAGLPREASLPAWPSATYVAPTRSEIVTTLVSQPPYLSPAERYQYSNLGMVVLGEVVSAVSGRPYAELVAERILAPLGMADTRPTIPTDLLGVRLPQGHSALRRDGTRDRLPVFQPQGLLPAAGYSSTVADLARFAAWQFRLLRGGGQELLKVSTLREMQRVQWTDPDGKNAWGLGFSVSREGANTVVGHAGRCPGYESAIGLALKDEVAVIALLNAQNAGPYTRQMRQLMLKGLRLPVAPTAADSPDLPAYAGRYNAQPWGSELIIVPWGKDLAALYLPSANPVEALGLLRHVSADTFRRVRDDDSLAHEVVFTRDQAGKVTGYREWSYESQRVGNLTGADQGTP